MKFFIDDSNKIDLHIHTCESDGEYYPEELLKKAQKLGIEYIAFTDHNKDILGKKSNKKYIYEEYGITAISGCEIDASLNGKRVHILAYNYKGGFRKFILPKIDKNFKEKRIKMPVKKICKLIHLFGGVAILAHPFKYSKNGKLIVEEILLEKCIDGIECIHGYHTKEEIDYLLKVCNDNDLIVTAGSDFHYEGRKSRDEKKQTKLMELPGCDSTIDEQLKLAKEKYLKIKR